MKRRTKLCIAGAITAILIISPALILWLRIDRSIGVIERKFDPRLLYSEVDGSVAIPLPTEFRSQTNFAMFNFVMSRSLFPYRISLHIDPSPPGGPKPAAVYYGRVRGRTNAYAFVFPPSPQPFEWQILFQGENVELLSFGSLNIVTRSNTYVWRTPIFRPTDDYTKAFDRANARIPIGTELFMRHGESVFGMIGQVTGRLAKGANARGLDNRIEVEFIHGVREWIPEHTLTNYFISR